MPRVIKHPDIRKGEVLAAARALFFEQGYDATSIDQVIARAGVSKGGFYHHFASKDDLLEALAELVATQSLAAISDVLDDETLNAFERLDQFLMRGRKLKIEQAPQMLAMFEAVFRAENLLLYHRLHRAVSRVMQVPMTRIIAQGQAEGSFAVADAEATAEIVLGLASTSYDSVARLMRAREEPELSAAIDAFERRMMAQSVAIDRLLGLPDGRVRFIEPGFTRALMAARPA